MQSSVMEITRRAMADFSGLLKFPLVSIIGVHPEESGWLVTAEMLEKTSIPDGMDILGIYEVHLDAGGGLKDFARTHLRKRGDTSG